MKHFLIALLLLVGAGLAWASENAHYDYSHCVPHCVTFEQIGEKHFAAARSAAGKLLALAEMESSIGVLTTAAYQMPLSAPDLSATNKLGVTGEALWSHSTPQASGNNCRVEMTVYNDETETQFILHIHLRIYCDGKLKDSVMYTLRVQKSVAPPP